MDQSVQKIGRNELFELVRLKVQDNMGAALRALPARPEASPEDALDRVRFTEAFITRAAAKVTEALLQDDRTRPLIPDDTYDGILDEILPTPTSVANDIAGTPDRIIKGIIQVVYAQHLKVKEGLQQSLRTLMGHLNSLTDPEIDPYDDCWRWIAAVRGLAAEHGLSPKAYFALPEAKDAIIRRTLSRAQFLARAERRRQRAADTDPIESTRLMIGPIIATMNEEQTPEIIDKMLEKIAPRIRAAYQANLDKIMTDARADADRIFGPET